MEELVTVDGVVVNPTFHDYLLPTIADVPDLDFVAVTHPQPDAPYGVKGVGEAPTCTATPAIIAAIRVAVGRDLRRVPVRPEDLVTISPMTAPPTTAPPTTPGQGVPAA
jgi:CO/xanthine dehydrogenase Mo-binding subunit